MINGTAKFYNGQKGFGFIQPDGGAYRRRSRGLDVADRDLAGLAVFLSVKGDLLTLVEAVQAGALERGRVDEHVLAARPRSLSPGVSMFGEILNVCPA